MVEINEEALICRQCEKHVTQASRLKRLLESSEKHFKQETDQSYFWNENLRELKAESTPSTNATRCVEVDTDVNSGTNEPADLSITELDNFIHEADNLLMQSLSEFENHPISQAKSTVSEERIIDGSSDMNDEGEIINEAKTAEDFLYMVTDEQINEMTSLITDILPPDNKATNKVPSKFRANDSEVKRELRSSSGRKSKYSTRRTSSRRST